MSRLESFFGVEITESTAAYFRPKYPTQNVQRHISKLLQKMSLEPPIPETRVLAVASHVRPFRHIITIPHTNTKPQVVYGSAPPLTKEPKPRHPFRLTSNRYVGNTMATFIMQALGCEVSALNTVQLSMPSPFPLPSSHPFPPNLPTPKPFFYL